MHRTIDELIEQAAIKTRNAVRKSLISISSPREKKRIPIDPARRKKQITSDPGIQWDSLGSIGIRFFPLVQIFILFF
jgi:hypothetical protein